MDVQDGRAAAPEIVVAIDHSVLAHDLLLGAAVAKEDGRHADHAASVMAAAKLRRDVKGRIDAFIARICVD